MTQKPMWRKRIVMWINKRGERHEKVIPERHSKKFLEYKRKSQVIRPSGSVIGKAIR